MKWSEVFYSHELTVDREYRFHRLAFYLGGVFDLSSERHLVRSGGILQLERWFDRYGTKMAVEFNRRGAVLAIRFQQTKESGVWSECYGAQIVDGQLGESAVKLQAKLIKPFDCPVDGFDLSLNRAIGGLQRAGARQVVLDRGNMGAIVTSGPNFVQTEFDDLLFDEIPESIRSAMEKFNLSAVGV
jgi:hypothetical protein